MQQTLVAVFDNRGDAQKALEELVSFGYVRDRVRLSEGDPAGETSLAPQHGADQTDQTDQTGQTGANVISSIRHFFGDLFGKERGESARLYTDAVARGHYVLTLDADSLPEVERAADIVERFGPIDIDEHAVLWSGAPRPGVLQQAPPGSQQLAHEGAPAPTQGAQQRAASMDIRRAERAGVRIYQQMELMRPAPDEQTYFRSHWSTHYGPHGGAYEEYEAAYAYGSAMASADLYRGRPWDDVEPNLRGDWEARNPDSAWQKVKAAIRHGWERITR
jgi:hypothetical protein